jgi:hypothetical protein
LFPGYGLGLLPWLRLAALAGLLAWSILRARRRWLRGEPDDQSRRILLPWIELLAGFSIYLGLFTILLMPVLLFQVVATVLLWVATPAIVSIVVVDLGAKAMQAERTGFWLGAGLVAWLAITFIWLSMLGIGDLLFVPGLWFELMILCLAPAAAAISWWSWLPGSGGGSGIAETFE